MPIIPNIGRKTPKVRAVILLVYAILVTGSITMIYPFLIMLSGSVKGNTDIDVMDAFPKVLYSKAVQFARFQEERYGTLAALSAAYSRPILKCDQAVIPSEDLKELKSFRRFLAENGRRFPDHFYMVQEMAVRGDQVLPRNFRALRREVQRECGTIETFNRQYSMAMRNWNDFSLPPDSPLIKELCYEKKPLIDRYLRFKKSRPVGEKVILNLDGCYFNTQKSFRRVTSREVEPGRILAATLPSGKNGKVWARFVKHNLNCMFVRLDARGLELFREWLRMKFPGGIAEANKINDSEYASFDSIKADHHELRNSSMFTLYTDFVSNICPAAYLVVDTPSTRYREYVKNPAATMPVVVWDYDVFRRTKDGFVFEAVTRNYLNVVQFVTVYGRAIFNTLVYIGLSILAALTINPLAAYALSRFNLKNTYFILMLFIVTMAFPGLVTMIPNFLLLKQFHLLNTFWALILPGLANGYSIFILKGFFDSIPKDVYESATIDGAGEWTMFWRFTMALSKPILALITLNAFVGAYTAFMFALIICPDEKMWTLMVWLYQLQQDAHQSVIYSALVLAAIPTLLVFVLAQNTIMKGIVIPVEK